MGALWIFYQHIFQVAEMMGLNKLLFYEYEIGMLFVDSLHNFRLSE